VLKIFFNIFVITDTTDALRARYLAFFMN